MIRNPILKGFNPDPSICRVGNDYYIATSTFEWYPGVQIHHSRDLVNWRLVTRPLDRAQPSSTSAASPTAAASGPPASATPTACFWLIYTDVKRYDGNFKDAHNYLVTAPAITGPWSDPVYMNSSGFDPSLFHDDDGRKWFLNQQWKHSTDSVGGRPRGTAFDGILAQEYDPVARRLTGPITNIFAGSPLALVEGPHLFKRDGWYYLTTAEGGTGYDHAVTMARSRSLTGPYELHPRHPPAHLQGRPRRGPAARRPRPDRRDPGRRGLPHPPLLAPAPRHSAARRSAARPRSRSASGATTAGSTSSTAASSPPLEVPAPPGAPEPEPDRPVEYRFDGPSLPQDFQWLRTPYPERLFTLTGDALRLHGRESVGSWFEQALVARRQQHLRYRAETRLAAFAPDTYQQNAGLTTYYNRSKFHFLAVTHDAALGRVLTILSCPGDWPDGRLAFPLHPPIPLPDGPVDLAVEVDGATPAVLLARRRRMAARRPRARRQRHLRRGRPRRARLLHRRLRRPARLRHLRPRRHRRLHRRSATPRREHAGLTPPRQPTDRRQQCRSRKSRATLRVATAAPRARAIAAIWQSAVAIGRPAARRSAATAA